METDELLEVLGKILTKELGKKYEKTGNTIKFNIDGQLVIVEVLRVT